MENRQMYGSFHTHFEDMFDAVTDIKTSVKNFIEAGAVKVAATGHGTFAEYENVQDAVSGANSWADELLARIRQRPQFADFEFTVGPNEKNSLPFRYQSMVSEQDISDYIHNNNIYGHSDSVLLDTTPDSTDGTNIFLLLGVISRIKSLSIIPGVEAYFKDNTESVDNDFTNEHFRHMILIAKNEAGFTQLSHIISDSNAEGFDTDGNKPTVSLNILRKNLLDENGQPTGNILCSSACIGGIFGLNNLIRFKAQHEKDALEAELITSGYLGDGDNMGARTRTQRLKELAEEKKNINRPTKAREKLVKAQGEDSPEYIEFLKDKDAWDEIADEIALIKDDPYAENDDNIIKTEKTKINAYERAGKTLSGLPTQEQDDAANIRLYNELISIVGKDNFYFELQNHNLPEEQHVYGKIIDMAYSVDSAPKFIASNDVHIGVPEWDKDAVDREVIRRNMAQYPRFNKYEPISADDKEYVIKADDTIKQQIKSLVLGLEFGQDKADEISSQAMDNIKNSLSGCTIKTKDFDKHYPLFPYRELGYSSEDEAFDALIEKDIPDKFPEGLPDGYRERLDHEKEVIKKMGYSGYHLIVQDYAKYASLLGYLPISMVKDAPLTIDELEKYVQDYLDKGGKKIGLGIGPGRGSAAGSLCCYILGITNIDPVKYDLYFERFLNTERVSMPDIDLDFKTDIRDKVYEYCSHRYGEENVCKIMTKSYCAPKGAFRFAGRYLLAKEAHDLGLTSAADLRTPEYLKIKKKYFDASAKLAKTVADLEKNPNNTESVIMDILEKQYADTQNPSNEVYRDILEHSAIVANMYTSSGQHAAGCIISSKPVKDTFPVAWNTSNNTFQIQCEMAKAEERGLLKMDLLGLSNLDIITEITKYPTLSLWQPLDIFQSVAGIEQVINDPNVPKAIFATGLTHGVFQFESPGMKDMLVKFSPETFEDFILLVAAYRPGPLDYIPEIIEQKWYMKDPQKYLTEHNGNKPKRSITLNNAALEEILAPTYGCPIYQEQIMRIFQEMAGYSLGGADIVRRYMSKKKVDKLAYEKKTFIYGDEARGIPGCMKKHGLTEREADDLFEQMMPFAKYGFNKSHATCYALISVFTAYLKYYRTEDFFRSSMTAMDNTDKIVPYITEAHDSFGIETLPPSIMKSHNKFTVEEKGKIRYGFSSIKGLGGLPDEFYRTTCAEEFIVKNPDIGIGDIAVLAELGLFKSVYYMQTESQTKISEEMTKGHNKDIIDFINTHGKTVRDNIDEADLITRKFSVSSKALSAYFNDRDNFFEEFDKFKDSPVRENKAVAEDKQNEDTDILSKLESEISRLGMSFSGAGYAEVVAKAFPDSKVDFGSMDAECKRLSSDPDKLNNTNVVLPAVPMKIESGFKTKSQAPYSQITLIDSKANVRIRRIRDADKNKIIIGSPMEFRVPLNKWFNISPSSSRQNRFEKPIQQQYQRYTPNTSYIGRTSLDNKTPDDIEK